MFLKKTLVDVDKESSTGRSGYVPTEKVMDVIVGQAIDLTPDEKTWIVSKFGVGNDLDYIKFLEDTFTQSRAPAPVPALPTKGNASLTYTTRTSSGNTIIVHGLGAAGKMTTLYLTIMPQFSVTWKNFRAACKDYERHKDPEQNGKPGQVPSRVFRSFLETNGVILTEPQFYLVLGEFTDESVNARGAADGCFVKYDDFIQRYLQSTRQS